MGTAPHTGDPCLGPLRVVFGHLPSLAVRRGASCVTPEGLAATVPSISSPGHFSYRKTIYGPNVISVPVKSYPQLLVDEVGLSLGLAPALAWIGCVTLARGLPC